MTRYSVWPPETHNLLSYDRAIDLLRKPGARMVCMYVDDAQGGVAFVPHPLSWLTRSIGPGTLDRVAAAQSSGAYFDGIELACLLREQQVPSIFLTGYDDYDTAKRARIARP